MSYHHHHHHLTRTFRKFYTPGLKITGFSPCFFISVLAILLFFCLSFFLYFPSFSCSLLFYFSLFYSDIPYFPFISPFIPLFYRFHSRFDGVCSSGEVATHNLTSTNTMQVRYFVRKCIFVRKGSCDTALRNKVDGICPRFIYFSLALLKLCMTSWNVIRVFCSFVLENASFANRRMKTG